MDFKKFITDLEQNENLFHFVLGLTKAELDVVLPPFEKTKEDRTQNNLDKKEKLCAFLLCKRWSLTDLQITKLALNKSDGRYGQRLIKNITERVKSLPLNFQEGINNISVLGIALEKNTTFDYILEIAKQMVGKSIVVVKQEKLVKADNRIIDHSQIKNTQPDTQVRKNISPVFVINSTAYVPSDTETDSSDDSSDERIFKFSETDFQNPPYYIQADKRGSLEQEITQEVDLSATHSSKVIQPLLHKLEDEGFADSEDNDSHVARENLSVNFCLNRPRSLSKGKNKALTKELSVPVDSAIPYKRSGLFWNYSWARKSNVTAESRNNPLTYKEVRGFYKQLKARDPHAARNFRRAQENQPRNTMVPYRELREETKNHNNTRMLVIDTRKKHQGSDVYLSFIDSDTQAFSYKGKGIYKTYTQLYHEGQAPEVMSTGYEFFHAKLPMLTLACMLDRAVRAATAQFIPLGIYYPEPNFMIKILDGHDTVEESFYEITPGGKISKGNYESPQEAPLILDKVVKRPNANRPYSFFFSDTTPLLSKTPDRATKNKSKTDFQFNGSRSENGKYVNWSGQDILNVTRNVSQSHVAPRSWAINLLHAFTLNAAVTINGAPITNGRVIRNLAISLLARLYGVYDPMRGCKKMVDLHKGEYSKELHRVLNNYNTQVGDAIKTTQRKKTKSKNNNVALEYIDEINSLRNLKIILQSLLSNGDVNQIENAAKASGEAIAKVLLAHLEFSVAENKQLQFQ